MEIISLYWMSEKYTNHLNHLMTVVQHEEWWSYVAGGLQQSKFGNAYYHSYTYEMLATCKK